MLGFRLNKLGAAIGSGFSLRSLFGGGSAGYSFSPYLGETYKQTYNQPGTDATAAGDPIGAMLPAHAYEGIINRLEWSDDFSQTSEWTSANVTVTANTKNDSGVGNTDGASPVADTLNATVAGGSISQSYTCTADTAVRTASIDLEAGTATNSTLSLVYTGGNTYSADISWSGGVPTVTHAGSAGASDVGATLQATGIYKIWVRGANTSRTTASLTLLPAASGTGTVFASRAQINDGSEVLAYQPNAGCLGGSNRRSGGANQITWSQDVANPAWTKTSTTAADDGTITATAALAAHRLQNPAIVTVASTQYTAWFDLVRTNHDFFQIFVNSTAGAGYVNFNINALTKSESTATGTIADNGDGSVRISITYTSGAVTTDYPVLCFITSLAAARGENWTPVGTETVRVVRAFRGFGSSLGTYTRNMGSLGGLITNVPLYQTTSGNRPLLARFPKTGIRQLFVNPRAISGSSWTKASCTVTDGVTSYDGTATASRLVSTASGGISGVLQAIATPNLQKTHSYILKAGPGTTWVRFIGPASSLQNAWINLSDGTVGTVEANVTAATPVSLGDGWWKCAVTGTGATTNCGLRLANADGSSNADLNQELYVADPQLEFGAVRTTWQNNINSADITESGVGYNYLPLYDGTSDYMTPGMQSWGTTQLQAAAQYAFTIFFVFRTVSANGGCIISQNNGAATAAMMFSLFVGSSTGAIGLNARGTAATAWGSDNRDGVFHVGALRWNGTSFDQVLDSGSLTAVTWAGGTLAATAIDIAVGMERVATAARPFNGHLGVAFIDRACTDAEMLAGVRSLNAIYRSGL